MTLRRNNHPLVSVYMPVYNGELFLNEAIQSIMSQTYSRLELVVVDDGSTDNTWSILRAWRDHFPNKIRIFRFRTNKGECMASNYALLKTQGAYVARMDADDIATTDRIEKQVSYLLSHPHIVALGSQAKIIDDKGNIVGNKHVPCHHDAIYRSASTYNPMIHPSIMFHRKFLPKRKNLYRRQFEESCDYFLYFDLFTHGVFANLPNYLLYYRIYNTNKSLKNLKRIFWVDTKLRFYAVRFLGYHASISMYIIIILQSLLVLILPQRVLKEIFYLFRGIKKINILKLPIFSLPKYKALQKTYVPTLRSYTP